MAGVISSASDGSGFGGLAHPIAKAGKSTGGQHGRSFASQRCCAQAFGHRLGESVGVAGHGRNREFQELLFPEGDAVALVTLINRQEANRSRADEAGTDKSEDVIGEAVGFRVREFNDEPVPSELMSSPS